LIELGQLPGSELTKESRPFDCEVCLKKNDNIAKMRGCMLEKYDYTSKDKNIFPIKLTPDGHPFGFCPAKAKLDNRALFLSNIFTVACETKQLYYPGGINNQPQWFIDILCWYAPMYDNIKWYSRMNSLFGGKGTKTTKPPKKR